MIRKTLFTFVDFQASVLRDIFEIHQFSTKTGNFCGKNATNIKAEITHLVIMNHKNQLGLMMVIRRNILGFMTP